MSSTSKDIPYKSVHKLLDEYDVPVNVYLRAVKDGSPSAVQQVCVLLKRELMTSAKLEGQGKTTAVSNGEIMRPSDINECLIRMLIAARAHPVGSLPLLLELVVEQLGMSRRVPILGDPERHADHEPLNRKTLAMLAIAADPEASLREVAKLAGVSHQTIAAWKKDPLFVHEVDQLGNEHSAERLQAAFREQQAKPDQVQSELLITFYKLAMEAAREELSGNQTFA